MVRGVAQSALDFLPMEAPACWTRNAMRKVKSMTLENRRDVTDGWPKIKFCLSCCGTCCHSGQCACVVSGRSAPGHRLHLTIIKVKKNAEKYAPNVACNLLSNFIDTTFVRAFWLEMKFNLQSEASTNAERREDKLRATSTCTRGYSSTS